MENEKKTKVSMSIEELERVGTTSDNPTLQQTLDLVRKYNQRFIHHSLYDDAVV